MITKTIDGYTGSVEPTDDRIIVEILPLEEQTTESGIILEKKEEEPRWGKVVACLSDSRFSLGNLVLFSKYGVDSFKEGGRFYGVLSEKGVLATVVKKR